MRAMVTGGAGFIGSNLVDGLLREGHQVVVLDDLSSGSRDNLEGLKGGGVEFWEMKLADPLLAQKLTQRPVDIVFHQAAQVDVRLSVAEPIRDAMSNIVDGLAFLQSLVQAGVSRVVYASTGGALYGDPDPLTLPCDESTAVLPISGYGVSKYCFEHYLRVFAGLHGLRTCVLRYANVYGPRQSPAGEAGVVAIFASRLAQGQAVTIFGDGGQTRDYVYVDDVVRANLLAAERMDGQTYNIGTGVETSVDQLLEALLEVIRPTSLAPVRRLPARAGDVRRIALSSEKARRELGWVPDIALRQGLEKTVASLAKKLGEK